MNNDIKVQVICVTYNQEKYIQDALESFIRQKTNFSFEVLVGDDCSTDKTSQIVAHYARTYPNIIKHIKRPVNQGSLANFMDLCDSVTAKYVAFCDGDDFWIDENKLQKQFDFMESHLDVRIHCHAVKMEIDERCNLSQFYLNQKKANIIPNNIPFNKKVSIKQVTQEIPQTSSLFIRWRKIEFPSWAKTDGKCGDSSVLWLQLGNDFLYASNEVMSIYRKCDSGVFFDSSSLELYFLKTRPEYFKILLGTIEYYKQNYSKCNLEAFEKRLSNEIDNFLQAVINTDSWNTLEELKNSYPDVYFNIKQLLLEYKQRYLNTKVLGERKAKLLKKKSTLKVIKPFLWVIYWIQNIGKILEKILRLAQSFVFYWLFALVPKKKNLWVFSGFLKKNYMDNTKYLFEYLVTNHPEIEVVWLTKSKDIKRSLVSKQLPVLKINSFLGFLTMIRASIAFSDHFKMSDYDCRFGFNANTKFVQLWHGVGPKGMVPKNDRIPNTTVPGVRLSSDIIINENDSFRKKIFKKIKYIFLAPFRELFEEYFGIICPGKPFVDYFADPWKTSKESQILSGYPRNILSYDFENHTISNYKIIYAPTYRWRPEDENQMIDSFIENLPKLNDFLEKINGEFALRLHPHTWRNYQNKISKSLLKYPRVLISAEKDIYENLCNYSLMITDYSSLGYDFLITQRPVVYFAFDYDRYSKTDCPFEMSYADVCAGEIVYNWDQLISTLELYYKNPDHHKLLRQKILEDFFPQAYNDKNNALRIVQNIKSRLKIK